MIESTPQQEATHFLRRRYKFRFHLPERKIAFYAFQLEVHARIPRNGCDCKREGRPSNKRTLQHSN